MRLVHNPTVRQCLLELLHAFVGDLGVTEIQLLEAGQSFQVLQARTVDLGAGENQCLEAGQSSQVLQPRVGDPGVEEVQ